MQRDHICMQKNYELLLKKLYFTKTLIFHNVLPM